MKHEYQDGAEWDKDYLFFEIQKVEVHGNSSKDDEIERYKKALRTILDEGATDCEGW